jgi:3-hydroxyacyl-CoA dehydrogenase
VLLSDDRILGLELAATLRLMRLRLAVTRGHGRETGGVAQAVVRAAQVALRRLHQMGVARDAIVAALDGHLRLPVALPDAPGAGGLALPPQVLRDRVFGALTAEGLRLLAAGAVPRAGVFDVLAATALAMPRHRGGPLLMADQRGLLLVRRDLQIWQEDDPVWASPPLMDDILSRGQRLSAWEATR